MRNRTIILCKRAPGTILLLVLFLSQGFAQPSQPGQTTPTASPVVRSAAMAGEAPRSASSSLAQITSGDLVEIVVFDTPELSQKVRVDNAGEVELVLGGKVGIAGLTSAQADQAVAARLREAKVLRNPHVSLNVVESSSQTVTVLGEVRNPGSYPIWGQQHVTEAIAAAGGLTQTASHSATLTRKDSNTPLTIEIDSSLQNPPGPEIVLLAGDRIVVAKAGIAYVLGDVGKPGGFVLDDRAPISVLQGLALAQGMNRTANSRGNLIRQTATGPQPQALDFGKILANQTADPTLHDGDIVYVPLNAVKDWANRGLSSILQMAVGVVIYGRY